MNLLEKLHAVTVSEDVQIWHFHGKKESPRFVLWKIKSEPHNKIGHWYHTMEEMIEAAYAVIDPLKIPFPVTPEVPPQAYADHKRTASCGCRWNGNVHGDQCPEHGTQADLTKQE